MSWVLTIVLVAISWIAWEAYKSSKTVARKNENIDTVKVTISPTGLFDLGVIRKLSGIKGFREEDDPTTFTKTKLKSWFAFGKEIRKKSTLTLTYLKGTDAVFVETGVTNNSGFIPLNGNGEADLALVELGRAEKNRVVELHVVRRLWNKEDEYKHLPVLTGYLKIYYEDKVLNESENEIKMLFNFPEALYMGGEYMNHNLDDNDYDKRLVNLFDLKKDYFHSDPLDNDLGGSSFYSIYRYKSNYFELSQFVD